MERKEKRELSRGIMIIAGFGFLVQSVLLLFVIVTGGSVPKFLTDEDGESNLGFYQFDCVVFILSTIVYLFSGGKFSRILDKQDYEN